jgi:glycosyltransferase involved in cell wall biosynthesis
MNLYLVDIESVETRYTSQWKWHLPILLQRNGINVQTISGSTDIPSATTPGAFLNFGGTNIYKSQQVEQMGRLFCSGTIKPGDHFLFTDAWHPGIINLKYMSELLNIPVKIHALWHAGSYDKHDFLGRLIGNAAWVRHAEKSFFHAIDYNYFASKFHIEMFVRDLLNDGFQENAWIEEDLEEILNGEWPKIVRSGWPMEYMPTLLHNFKQSSKRDLIVFPHRIAPEKQVDIFRDLADNLPQYEFIVCQDQNLTKDQYHNILSEAKIVFSASLQETLGIGCYEGALLGAIPIVPDRLSYKEMYFDMFKYPSVWTESWDSYKVNKDQLCHFINITMQDYNNRLLELHKQTQFLTQHFFSANKLVDNILSLK